MNYTDLNILTSGMLGDKYVDPRRRISRQLYKSGADTSPIAHPMQGYARLAQTLAGMYGDKMMFDERGRTADAFNRAQPESFRPGDVENDEVLLEEFMGKPEVKAWLASLSDDGTVEGGLKTFQGTPAKPEMYDAARANELPGLEGHNLQQYLPAPEVNWKEAELGVSKSPDSSGGIDAEEHRRLFALAAEQGWPKGGGRDPVGWQRDALAEHDIRSLMVPDPQLPGFSVGDQLLPPTTGPSGSADFQPDMTESGLPISPDFDPNELFETLRAQSRGPDVSTQMPDIDWKIQQLLAEGNPGSRNLAMQLQMMKMDKQAAAGLKKSERAETLSDLELGHEYAKELAQMRIDAKDPRTPKMKDFERGLTDPDFMEFVKKVGAERKPAAAIQYWDQRQKMINEGASQEDLDRFDSYVRASKFMDVGGETRIYSGISPLGTPPTIIPKTPPPQTTPEHQAEVEAAKVTAKKKAEAEWDAPKAKLEMDRMMGVLNQIYKRDEMGKLIFTHPGFESLIGATPIPFRRHVHGTQTFALDQIVEQVKSKNFLMAFQQLKGGGHITEIEGDKATAAIAAVHIGMPEEDFIVELEKVKDVLRTGYENMRRQAGLVQPDIRLQTTPGPTPGPINPQRREGDPFKGFTIKKRN